MLRGLFAVLGLLMLFAAPLRAATTSPGGFWALRADFTDDAGQLRRTAHYAGVPTIVAMEYAQCRFVCSINWRRLADIQAEADRRKLKLQFVIVSLDPANDSPVQWREYRRARGLERDNWHFLTGSRSATDAAVSWLGVRWWRYDGSIMHEFRIVRLDEHGQIVRVMDSFDQPAARFLND